MVVGQEQVHPTFVLAKEALAVCGDVKNTKVVGLHSHGLVPTPATNGKTDAGSAQMPKTNLKFNIEVFTMKKILLVLVCMVTMISLQAQNFNRSINLNIICVNDTTFDPFDANTVTSIGISGQVTFTSDLGFVRIVVSDNNDDEYLVYEAYRIYEDNSVIAFSQKCNESCFYETYAPNALKIYVFDAQVVINSINYSNTFYQNAESRRVQAARNAYLETLSNVQNHISDNNLIWVADSTDISKMSYAEKVRYYGEGYRSYGFDFYKRGFFSVLGPNSNTEWNDGYVDNFDWRNRHGATNPALENTGCPYLDPKFDPHETNPENNDISGWLTPLVCQQGCWNGSSIECIPEQNCTGIWRTGPYCWAFGPVAYVEALANLYYNQHIDIDLSEEKIIVEHYGNAYYQNYGNDNLVGFNPAFALNLFKLGVPDEDCMPFTGGAEPVVECNDPNELVSINSFLSRSNPSSSLVKEWLMNYGPICCSSIPSVSNLTHCMALSGWGTIDEDNVAEFCHDPNNAKSWFGKLFWIYKDQFGAYEYNAGYQYVIHNPQSNSDFRIFSIPDPITTMHRDENDIQCLDWDGDGYYNWGIGQKPAHCPACPDEPDGDDTNPSLGPLSSNGTCTIINDINCSFEDGWGFWVQSPNDNSLSSNWWRKQGQSDPSGLSGPSHAQDGDHYIYVDADWGENYNGNDIGIESATINMNTDFYVDFYVCMHATYYGANYSLQLLTSIDNGEHWSSPVWKAIGNQGEGWKHFRVGISSDVNKIKFKANLSGYQYCDIALDNISIRHWVQEQPPIIITGTETWDQENYLNQDIIIDNGGKLVLQGYDEHNPTKTYIHPDCKIIVKPGGQLIVNNSWLLPFPETQMWQGIEVWGNPNDHQYCIDGRYLQGYVELGNRAVIQKAVCALRLYSSDEWGHMGGIVHADGAIFRDNNKNLHAWYYRNFHPYNHKETNYNSYFKNCKFEFRSYEELSDPPMFFKHIDLCKVRGISFKGCEFSIPSTPKDYISLWSCGIAAYDAGFTVDGICQDVVFPCTSYKKTRFKHFFNAILVDNPPESLRGFSVKNTEFINNAYGIFARNADFATVLYSLFRVGKHCNLLCSGGIYLDGISYFKIEENDFRNNTSVEDIHTFGVIVSNSGASNTVYRNSFRDLKCGNLAFGVNHKHNEISQGLIYGCNDNFGNGYDFFVLKDPNLSQELNGPQQSQGSLSLSSGNTFSPTADYHFYNDGNYDIDYFYYNSGNEIPDNSRLYKVVRHNAPANDCASNYGTDPQLVLSSVERQQRESDYYNAYATYNNIKMLYESRVDGGNTSGTLADLENARPEDMWQLRAKLLGGSPYLSQEVLMKASDRTDVFPNSVLFDILASNPDELKKDTLINYLENKEQPLPAYMVDILRQVAGGTSLKTVMLGQMANYKHSYTEAASSIIRSMLNDTIIDNAALRGWLGNLNDINADYDIVSTYIAENDFNEALTFANLLPDLYQLEGAALEEHDDYMDLLYLYRDLHLDGRNIMQLSNAEKALVQHIADHGAGKPKVMAISILEGAYSSSDYFYCHELNISGGGNRSIGLYVPISPETLGKIHGLGITAVPNPAQTWVVFGYTLPEDATNAVVTVTDMLGTTVGQFETGSAAGEYVWNCTDVKPGIYYYTIVCDGMTQTGKLVITK